jgi:hypothetical protein
MTIESLSLESWCAALGIDLPAPPIPLGVNAPVVRSGDLLFLSGMLPLRDGGPACTGGWLCTSVRLPNSPIMPEWPMPDPSCSMAFSEPGRVTREWCSE